MSDYTANSGSSLTTLFASRTSTDPSLNYLTGYENTAGVDFSDLFLPRLPWNTAISNTNYEYNGNDLATLFNPANTPTLPFVIDITSTTGGWTYFLGNSVVGLENSFTIVIADYASSPPSLSSPIIGSNTVSAKMTFLNPENIQNFNAIIVGGGGNGADSGATPGFTGGAGQGGYGGQLATDPLYNLTSISGSNFTSGDNLQISVGGRGTDSSITVNWITSTSTNPDSITVKGSAGGAGSAAGDNDGGSLGGGKVVIFGPGNPTAITDVWAGGDGASGYGDPQAKGYDGWKPTISHFTAGTNYSPPVYFGGGGGAFTDGGEGSKGGYGGGGGYGGTASNWPNGLSNYDTTNNLVNGINYAETNSAVGGLNGTGGGGAGTNDYTGAIAPAGSGIVIFQFQVAGWTPPANFPTTGSGGPGSG